MHEIIIHLWADNDITFHITRELSNEEYSKIAEIINKNSFIEKRECSVLEIYTEVEDYLSNLDIIKELDGRTYIFFQPYVTENNKL